ncbi:MAG: CHASE2 domain-containing protein [Betaproteobacteria bacterium]|nr:CHASE2 domain-containing protein [Betaproteobacteria bacterium]
MSRTPPVRIQPSSLAAILTAALLALAGLAMHLSPWGAQASLAALDAGFGILRAFGPTQAPDDILVVGLDDASAVSPEVDPLGPALRKLPDVLVRIARGSPRAIALLVTLPRTSLEAAAPGWDDALATALSVAQAAAPLAIGMGVDSRREVVPIHEPLLRGVDPRSLVFTILPRDEDGRVRQVGLTLPTQQGEWPTSAGWLCEVLGGHCAPGIIDYGLGPAYRMLPARRLLEIRDDEALARLFRGRIVFVSQVAGPDDRVPQPLSLAGWEPPSAEPPAVLAHAQSVRTLLHGRPVEELPLPAIVLAIAAMALVAACAAPAVGVLVAAGACASALLALRLGWYVPLAAPLATLLAAVLASRILGRTSQSSGERS